MPVLVLLVAPLFLLASGSADQPRIRVPLADVKVTQKYLWPLCLNGAPVTPGERRWRLPLQTQSLAFTMRSTGQGAAAPDGGAGVALVHFTPEAGHRYEIEVRAPAASYSYRAWKQGEWKPVVRDRTSDRIVSDEPAWTNSACR
jgi:hypothetical protein